jgi:hypothetical protein
MQLSEKRKLLVGAIPAWYSGALHFLGINVGASALVVGCVLALESPAVWQLGVGAGSFAFANLFEWWVHRGPLHKRTRFLERLYQRHTKEHHVVFTHLGMQIEDLRQLKLVLFPPWVLPLMVSMAAPVPALLWALGSRDLALVFFASAMAYYLVYEWLHLLHHWPRDTWLGRRWLVRTLRRHHTRHHDPARMTRGNFNVSFPLADWLLGSTLAAGEGEGEEVS